LIVGLVIAALMSIPLFFFPPAYAWPGSLFLFIVLGSLVFGWVRTSTRTSSRWWHEAPGERARDRRSARAPTPAR
jgi:hypothetical protein